MSRQRGDHGEEEQSETKMAGFRREGEYIRTMFGMESTLQTLTSYREYAFTVKALLGL